MNSLVKEANVRVSSVLNRDVKQFGKKFLFDGDEETCWNSDQGTPQWIQFEFSSPVELCELQIKFQGGFVGQDCFIEGAMEGQDLEKLCDFYPEDINRLQTFKLSNCSRISKAKIIFSKSTDFFGRVTIYQFDLLGNKGNT